MNNRVVEAMQKAYDDMVGQNMVAMAVGHTLCIHQALEEGVAYVTHHIPAGETCTKEGQKTQYGPKTAEQDKRIKRLLEKNPGLAKRVGLK